MSDIYFLDYPMQPNVATNAVDVTVEEPLVFETLSQPQDIISAQQFRAQVFSQMYPVMFDNKQDVDAYDQYSIHVVVKTQNTQKIVAYTRIITPEAKRQLGKYYSEQEYNLDDYLLGKSKVYELGRTCVDSEYRKGKALAILWRGLLPLLFDTLQAKHIIGCVSLSLGARQEKIAATSKYLKQLPKKQKMLVKCHRPVRIEDWITDASVLPERKKKRKNVDKADKVKMSKLEKSHVPPLFKKYKKMKATFATRPYYDPVFNCLDYFAAIEATLLTRIKIQMVCKFGG